MVIGRKVENGIQIIVVILADGEFLPDNLNHAKVVAFRQGESTSRQLKLVKELGKAADISILRPPPEPVCNYDRTDGDPLHQHVDETWWFYEQSWNLENGPYGTYEVALDALQDYCERFQSAKEEEENAFATIEKLAQELNIDLGVKDEEVLTKGGQHDAGDPDHTG